MPNTIDSTVEAISFERTIDTMKQNVEAATAAQSQSAERAMKNSRDLAAFSQGTLEACVQAGQIYASGSQTLLRQVMESSQAAFAETLVSFRALVTAKTVKERIELQANFVRSSALWAVGESSRFANSSIELAEKVAAPITARAIEAASTLATVSKA